MSGHGYWATLRNRPEWYSSVTQLTLRRFNSGRVAPRSSRLVCWWLQFAAFNAAYVPLFLKCKASCAASDPTKTFCISAWNFLCYLFTAAKIASRASLNPMILSSTLCSGGRILHIIIKMMKKLDLVRSILFATALDYAFLSPCLL